MESQNTQLAIEESQNRKDYSDEKIERKEIVGTPIVIIGNKERGYAPVVGKNRLTEWHTSIEEAEESVTLNNWEFLINLISAVARDTMTQKEKEKKEEKN